MGLNCFIILKDVMDGCESKYACRAEGAEGDQYLLLLIIVY